MMTNLLYKCKLIFVFVFKQDTKTELNFFCNASLPSFQSLDLIEQLPNKELKSRELRVSLSRDSNCLLVFSRKDLSAQVLLVMPLVCGCGLSC